MRGGEWGLNLQAEDEIRAYQNNLEDDQYAGVNEEDIELLNVERLLELKITEKQKQALEKIDNMRRKLKSLMDKKEGLQKKEESEFDETQIKGQIGGLDQKT